MTTKKLSSNHVHIKVGIEIHQKCIWPLPRSRYHEDYFLRRNSFFDDLKITHIFILDIVELNIVIGHWDGLPDLGVDFVIEFVQNA